MVTKQQILGNVWDYDFEGTRTSSRSTSGGCGARSTAVRPRGHRDPARRGYRLRGEGDGVAARPAPARVRCASRTSAGASGRARRVRGRPARPRFFRTSRAGGGPWPAPERAGDRDGARRRPVPGRPPGGRSRRQRRGRRSSMRRDRGRRPSRDSPGSAALCPTSPEPGDRRTAGRTTLWSSRRRQRRTWRWWSRAPTRARRTRPSTPLLAVGCRWSCCSRARLAVVGRALRPVEAMRREAAAITGDRTCDRRLPDARRGRRDPPAGGHHERDARPDRAPQQPQRQFVSDASHELRSPLAAIRQLAEVATILPAPGGARPACSTRSWP